jgi:endonuclease YncB( thermonuclease family)
MKRLSLVIAAFTFTILSCAIGFTPPTPGTIFTPQPAGNVGVTPAAGEQAVVTSVTDGDTIEVQINGVGYRVRYVGVNTPERDEACYRDARDFNASLVQGRTVTLTRDVANTDRYGRLLRYVYADGVFVNEQLILNGYAETVQYDRDRQFFDYFVGLEQQAAAAGRGCHATGLFNDGDYTR